VRDETHSRLSRRVFGRRGRGRIRRERGRPGPGAAARQRHAQPIRRDGPALQRVPRRRRFAGPLLRRLRPGLPVRAHRTAVGQRERLAVAVPGGRRYVPGHAVLLAVPLDARRRLHQPAPSGRHGHYNYYLFYLFNGREVRYNTITLSNKFYIK